jgi:cytochrome c oxidase subunit 2
MPDCNQGLFSHIQEDSPMKQSILILPIFLYSILISNLVLADGDPIEGKTIYTTCVVCHGHNGEGIQTTNGPRLSGQRESYLVSQLQKFRSGLRGANPEDIFGAQMTPLAKALPNEQSLLDVAAYIGTLQASRPARTEVSGDPMAGREGFKYCERCHGPTGLGYKSPKVITYRSQYGPRLSGQHDWYLIRQIQNFKAHIRGTKQDKAGWYMQADVQSLHNDQEIKDVVAYIGTLE